MTKFFLISKTILGGLIATVPALMTQTGVTLPELPAFLESILALLDPINEAVGLGLVVWGRATAKRPIALLPNKE